MSTSRESQSGATAQSVAPGGLAPLALDMQHVDKSFGAVRALKGASLRVRQGTVHALLGGNGSGKSTIIKILAAVYTADAGQLVVNGTSHQLKDHTPAAAQRAGLRFVHQDLGLFAELSVEENFALDAGYPRHRSGRIDWKTLRARVRQLLADYELDIDPRRPVRDLRPSDRTMVAIARALQDQEQGATDLVLVLDEPTASLAAHESELLLSQVRRRAELGQTVVMVSHRLQEVLAVAHDYTIFRDGAVVGNLVDAGPTEDELIEIIAGSLVPALRPTGSTTHSTGRPVLQLRELSSGPLRSVDLTVHEGEIVGLAGLVGSGRSSLLQTVLGGHQPESGHMELDGQTFEPPDIRAAVRAGVAMVPEDRKGDAAFPDLSIRDNLSMTMFQEYWASRWMPRSRETAAAKDLVSKFGIKVSGPTSLMSSMSGGNQQKTVIARWLQRSPRLLLLDEPTQGVDVMSRSDIYAVIREAARAGCAVLVASSDVTELQALSDRVLVLSGGVITDEVLAGELDVDGLTSLILKDRGATKNTSITESFS